MKTPREKAFAREFDSEVRKLNAIITFAIYCLSLLLIKLLYDSLVQLPTVSLEVIISVAVLMLAGAAVMFKRFAHKSVQRISVLATKLDSLLATTSEIRAEIHTDILLEKILHNALAMSGAEGAILYTVENDRLVCRNAEGNGLEKLKGSSLPLMEGVPGWVVKSSLVVRLGSGATTIEGLPEKTGFEEFMCNSLLFAPMITHSKVVGVIGLCNLRKGESSGEDEAIISYFADQAAISLENARLYEDQLNFETHISEILLQAMDAHRPIKRAHSENVARYSHLIGKAINLPFAREKNLHIASMLHDIGFIKYRPETEMTDKVFRHHCLAGYTMLKSISVYKDVAPIVLHHHERFDGTGYPNKLKGEDIPLEARIIAIAEAFDAMTSASTYKQSMGMGEAVHELLTHAGTQFDPALVKIFIDAIYQSKVRIPPLDKTAQSGRAQVIRLHEGEGEKGPFAGVLPSPASSGR
ncbi:HD family phosphohydrolase [Geomobilimonas luticola]|uniref:HD domain-containing protein n=1 Tax=Geomobilimonas luticola TaxID=1114878 RepID=A0ABS5SGV7_9BACT|nr:HD family phosphohydrolase [Geomobilimonas luticola]MBT0654594.1 HD domain-containing protein [Geomobilimonas luticola]